MKPIFLGSFMAMLLGMLLGGIFTISCGDDDDPSGSDGDTDNDTDSDADSDTDGDTDGDTDSGTDGDTDSDTDSDSDSDTDSDSDSDSDADCGVELTACCDGTTCDSGLDPVAQFDGTCQCQKPCTFSTCTAGDEDGYCMLIYGTEINACYNVADIPMMDATAGDCTVGDEDCTSDSGASSGTECISLSTMSSADFSTYTVPRCLVSCDNPPTECSDTAMCFPGMTADYSAFDFTVGHCMALAK